MKKISRSSKLQCAFCQGKGTQPGAERLSCIVCQGSGRVRVRQPYSICKECEGRGRKPGANLYCLPCHGKGFVEESRNPSIAKSPVSKTRRKRGKKSVKPSPKANPLQRRAGARAEKARKIKAAVKKERKSFFKKFFSAIKIL